MHLRLFLSCQNVLKLRFVIYGLFSTPIRSNSLVSNKKIALLLSALLIIYDPANIENNQNHMAQIWYIS